MGSVSGLEIFLAVLCSFCPSSSISGAGGVGGLLSSSLSWLPAVKGNSSNKFLISSIESVTKSAACRI